MKVVYLADIRIPTEKAHGIQIMKMCEAFSCEKTEVELIVPNRKNGIKADPFEYYKVKNNFLIKKINVFNFDYFKFCHFNLIISSIAFIFSAKIYLYNKKFNILYVRDPYYGLFFKNTYLELHNVKNTHNYFYKKSLKLFTKIFVLTSYIKNELIKIGVNEDNIIITPDGVDLEKFNNNIIQAEAKRKLGLPQDKKLILYTGHLYSWKGTDTLADTARFFGKDVEFIFVGGTENDLALFKEKYSTIKNIKIIGQKPHSVIPLYLAAADVLVLPNSGKEDISRYYTSPLKLFEYMTSGRPIVASDLPSIREILNEDNAVFFESDNSESLASAIKKVLSDNELARKISEKALVDVQNYSWKKRAENIIRKIEL